MKERKLRGVIGIIEKDGKYLFGLESKEGPMKGKWRLLGGKLKARESPEQALHRELREETGIEVLVDGHLGRVNGTHGNILIDVYHGRYASGEINPKLDENSRIGWFDYGETLEMDMDALSAETFDCYLRMKRTIAEAKEIRSNGHYFGPYMGCDAGAIG